MSMYHFNPNDSSADAATGTVANGPILQDVACRKCGYNLRGLLADGRCPECGTAVGFSLQGDLLRFCDPSWVETLWRGTRISILGIVLNIAGGILTSSFIFRMMGIGTLMLITGRIVTTAGCWFMTQPDPSGVGEDAYGTARKVIRVSLISGIIQQGLNRLSTVVTIEPTVYLLIGIALFILGILDVVGLFAELNYLKKLARRVPDDKLSRRSGFLMYTLGTSFAFMIMLGMARMLAFRVSGTRLPRLAAITGFGALVVFSLGVSYILLIVKLGRQFKEQALAARATWAGSGLPARATLDAPETVSRP